MSKIWNDWGLEDGDYIPKYNKLFKKTFFVNADSTIILLGVVVFSVAFLAMILI